MNYNEDNRILVSVFCETYNHELYIRDCLDGMLMQKTDFSFEILIHDDASTDHTQMIIKEYAEKHPDVIKPILQHENQYSKGVNIWQTFQMPRARGKYIALCEGDDYWTDPLKLQKQVDFLEKHEEYSMCCHRYKIYIQKEDTWDNDYVKNLFDEQPDGFSFSNKENLNTWITKTLTLVYRSDCYDPNELQKYKYTCDEHNCYHLLKKGMGYCFPFFGGVYRRTDSSVFSPLSDKQKFVRWCQIRSEMLNNNLDDKDLRDKMLYETRWCLYEHDLSQELLSVITACIRSYYHTDGFKGALVCLKKLLKSYVNGFCRK